MKLAPPSDSVTPPPGEDNDQIEPGSSEGRWMRRLTIAVIVLILAATGGPRAQNLNPHPRIWLTSQMLADITAKRDSSDPDWMAIKSETDSLLSRSVPRVTIVGATNTNPVQFTTKEPVPWSNTVNPLYVSGGTGAWAGANNGPADGGRTATRTGSNTFTIPVDARPFGSFDTQKLTVFFAGGEGNEYFP